MAGSQQKPEREEQYKVESRREPGQKSVRSCNVHEEYGEQEGRCTREGAGRVRRAEIGTTTPRASQVLGALLPSGWGDCPGACGR